MRFRKLRIAWSVVCGIACVLLVVFWVRSYFKVDYVFYDTAQKTYSMASYHGRLRILWTYCQVGCRPSLNAGNSIACRLLARRGGFITTGPDRRCHLI